MLVSKVFDLEKISKTMLADLIDVLILLLSSCQKIEQTFMHSKSYIGKGNHHSRQILD